MVSTKIELRDYYTDNINYMNEGIELTVELITQWKEQRHIKGIISIDNKSIIDNFDDITEWINNPRVLGKKYKKVEIFFEIQIVLSVLNLVKA